MKESDQIIKSGTDSTEESNITKVKILPIWLLGRRLWPPQRVEDE